MIREITKMEQWAKEKEVITFPAGIFGFTHCKWFMLLQSDSMESEPDEPAFRWLQSVDDPDVAFVVADPDLFIDNYWDTVGIEDLRDCNLNPYEIPIPLVIVTIPENDSYAMSVNLLAPIVICPIDKMARQVILSNSVYSFDCPVFERVRESLVGLVQ